MASLGIISGVNYSNLYMNKSHHQISHPNPSLFLSNPTKKRSSQTICASMGLDKPCLHEESSIDQQKDSIFSSKIDDWMEETAHDIVNNLNQAPLLVHIYDKNGKAKFKTEKAIMGNWPLIKSKSPDGLIFVDEIEDINDDDNEKDLDGIEEGVTKAWGIVVQGKGKECGGPACYLLKTSRVRAGLGLGMCCTHFCLMRVKSFRKSALRQFEESWLLK